ncbi:MAG: nitrite reductase small subunit NirD [Nitrincola sp.]|nr:nitrite reductase small subunit NirD [Nitrincola sp.]
MNSMTTLTSQWLPICTVDNLIPNSGIVALLNGESVAIFWLPHAETKLYALSHLDPFSGAEVIGHGLICESKGRWSVASPVYKQHFDLETGQCLESDEIKLTCYPVRIHNNWVELQNTQAKSQLAHIQSKDTL